MELDDPGFHHSVLADFRDRLAEGGVTASSTSHWPASRRPASKGALRYHGVGPRRLAEIVRLRTVARLGVDVRIGIGPTITVAATASRQIGSPGGILGVDHDQVDAWLAPLPVEALHGIGPRQATALRGYGVDSVGLLAALPPATVQRILGGRAGRLAADRARGIDPRPVTPRTLPTSTTPSPGRPWTGPRSAPPYSNWSSSSDSGCAGASRLPAPWR
ncbi:hypothetical protein [Streptomyces sp. NPDC050535]|uniref:hypothetical protein n=1 Tax=Streptomyces sp. NPDC050535 TaxID=3365626 RepID=UPI0037936E88